MRRTLIPSLILAALALPGITSAQTVESESEEYEFLYLPEDVERERLKVASEIYENYPVFSDEWRQALGLSLDVRRPFVIDFNATWCGPCLTFAPTYKKYAALYAGKIDFTECDIDQNRGISMRYGVKAIPNIVFFTADGHAVKRFIGAPSVSDFEATLDELFESSVDVIEADDSEAACFHIDGTPASPADKGILVSRHKKILR